MRHDDRKTREAHIYLMSLDLNAPRAKLRDRIKGDPAARARGWLTLNAEYGRRATFAREMAKLPSCVYPAWVARRSNHWTPTERKFPDPRREYPLASYVAEFERLNGLAHIHTEST